MPVRDMVKSVLRAAGIDVRRHRPASRRRADLMAAAGVRTVLDVGASIGQDAAELRAGGFDGDIVSFEPLSDAFRGLERAAIADERWHCHNVAVSDRLGTSSFNVAGNSASSSLLTMGAAHSKAAPHARMVGTQEVELRRLDEWAGLSWLPQPWMSKLDVQGHEAAALNGAAGILHTVAVAEIELSVRELYKGAPSTTETLQLMASRGFSLIALEPGFHDPRDGAVLQCDGLFGRSGSDRLG